MHFLILFALFGVCLMVAPIVFAFVIPIVRLLLQALWHGVIKWIPSLALIGFIGYGIWRGMEENEAFNELVQVTIALAVFGTIAYRVIFRPLIRSFRK